MHSEYAIILSTISIIMSICQCGLPEAMLYQLGKSCKNLSKLAINKDTDRVPGKGPISTFNYGIECIDIANYDYIVKLDADMGFNNNYFEFL